jgi:hypothetical protein
MSSDRAFVPLEAWIYHSPDVQLLGKSIDIGLLMEALVYYDQVYFGITSDEQFAQLVLWFRSQGAAEELIALLGDEVLIPYYYAFVTLAGSKDNIWGIINIQDEEQGRVPVFERRVLRSGKLEASTRKASLRERVIDAALRHHVEVKADGFGSGLRNAEADYQTPGRAALLIQVLVDRLHRELGFLTPPRIDVRITEESNRRRIDWGFDFGLFERKLGKKLAVHPGVPLAAAAFGTKTLWTASELRSDLYMGSPAAKYLELKLGEGGSVARTKSIVDALVVEVAFPSIRQLVNEGKIGLHEVMVLRGKAGRFRQWLRKESELDRNALIAYHEEIAKEAGWRAVARRVVSAASIVGGAAVGSALAGPIGAVGGAMAGEATKFVLDLASKLDEGWRPRVFGDWASARVASWIAEREDVSG